MPSLTDAWARQVTSREEFPEPFWPFVDFDRLGLASRSRRASLWLTAPRSQLTPGTWAKTSATLPSKLSLISRLIWVERKNKRIKA